MGAVGRASTAVNAAPPVASRVEAESHGVGDRMNVEGTIDRALEAEAVLDWMNYRSSARLSVAGGAHCKHARCGRKKLKMRTSIR